MDNLPANYPIPTVHLGGTPGARLEETAREALDALRTSRDRLLETAPNARDYPVGTRALEPVGDGYTVGASSYRTALFLHESRIRMADRLIREMEHHLEAVLTGLHP